MIFSWLRSRRRKRILAQPFPAEWEQILRQNVAQYEWLNDAEGEKLKRCVQICVAEKSWEGCNGLEITDEIKVTIAGQACLLVLGFEEEYFDRLQTVLVYPDTYVAQETTRGPAGVVTETDMPRLGETWFRGPVIVSWASVQTVDRPADEGHNVVLHEFAHYLDMQSELVDGTPLLEDAQHYQTWHEVMTDEYNRLVSDAQAGRATLLDHYGATNAAEFFAVATECFFEQPKQMASQHQHLYELLKRHYRQDPAARVDR